MPLLQHPRKFLDLILMNILSPLQMGGELVSLFGAPAKLVFQFSSPPAELLGLRPQADHFLLQLAALLVTALDLQGQAIDAVEERRGDGFPLGQSSQGLNAGSESGGSHMKV